LAFLLSEIKELSEVHIKAKQSQFEPQSETLYLTDYDPQFVKRIPPSVK
jgi:hypothetical protein